MKKRIKNIGASVRAKLFNIAKNQGISFNRILLLYIQERFLYRLSKSRYKKKFVLKGGILFYGFHKDKARSTKDIDFLAQNISNDQEKFLSYMQEIISTEADDGIQFSDQTSIEAIVETAHYEGLRAKLIAKLDTAVQTLQIDIGFSDRILPHPVTLSYPALLDDDSIRLVAYSWESVIAEKFETIVKLGELNSSMRDFYDIYFLLGQQNFKGQNLKHTIQETFKNRKTDIANANLIFSDSFFDNQVKHVQWNAFLRKNELKINITFRDLMLQLKEFLSPSISGNVQETGFYKTWNKKKKIWIKY